MIQDIQPHQFDNQYRPCPPDAQSYALYYEGQTARRKGKMGLNFQDFVIWNGLMKKFMKKQFICLRLTRVALSGTEY